MTNSTRFDFKRNLSILICLLSLQAFSQTFDWESAVDNGDNATQTVNGVTATVTTNIITSITDNIAVLEFWSGASGTSGKTVLTPAINNSNSLTVTFSAPIDIATIYAFDADRITGQVWTFTPIGGSNAAVSQRIQNDMGSTLTVNWTNVTSFTITSAGGNDTFGLDDIVFAKTLSTEDYKEKNTIAIYPNPSSNYINVKGLNKVEPYRIFDIQGREVLSGTALNGKPISIQNLSKGMFFVSFTNKETLKFVKE